MILFVLPAADGHVLATMRLAELLLEARYDVRYLLLARSEAASTPIRTMLRSLGLGASLVIVPPHSSANASAAAWESFAVKLEAMKPALVLFDVFLYSVGVLCTASGISSAQVSTDLPHRIDLGAPPGPLAVIPSAGPVGTVRMAMAWAYHLTRSVIVQASNQERRRAARASRAAFSRLLAAAIPRPRIRYTAIPAPNGGLHPRFPDLPELVFTSRLLDFPRRNTRNVHWLGPLIRERRPHTTFPFQRLNPNKRIVYCALGTAEDAPGVRSKVMHIVTRTMATLPQYQLVLVGGGGSAEPGGAPEAPGDLPKDAIWVSSAPQIEVLERASVAIIHGGFNTIRECIAMGVAMVVIPIGPTTTDRPRNAALVEYLGLGRTCSLSRLTEQRLRTLVLSVAGAAIATRCTTIRDELRTSRVRDERHAVDVVRGIIAASKARGENTTATRSIKEQSNGIFEFWPAGDSEQGYEEGAAQGG